MINALLMQAKAKLGVPMAGMTHMQHAQPILLSHFLLAHGELRELAGGLEVEEYREGPVTYPNGERAFRASIVARRRKSI